MPKVNPEILEWARETAGFSIEKAVEAVDLRSAGGKTGPERLVSLERGEADPSRPLLLKMAQKYRRPLLVFYLDKVPRQGGRGQDFRTVSGATTPGYDATLDALIRDLNTRQNLVRSLLEDENAGPLPFIGSVTMGLGAERVSTSISEQLGFDLEEFRNQDSIEKSFVYLRSRIEASGIFVLLIGNLGTYHTSISPEVFRGFAIADNLAPFVVINDQDAKAAWSFTALHEVAHLWLGATGISGASHELQIESFCNDVAGKILLTEDEVQILSGRLSSSFDEAVERISVFADERNLSRAMVTYALLRANSITKPYWRKLKDRFHQEWVDAKTRGRDRQQGERGGPNYYVVKRHRLGVAFINLVARSLSDELITIPRPVRCLGSGRDALRPC